jgi:hypothetical protein
MRAFELAVAALSNSSAAGKGKARQSPLPRMFKSRRMRGPAVAELLRITLDLPAYNLSGSSNYLGARRCQSVHLCH